MRGILLAVFGLALGALPASADSITIDSSNCGGDCYGLRWTLTVNQGAYSYLGNDYSFEAILQVADDPLLPGTPNHVISAVDVKVSSGVTDAALYLSPTTLANWTTSISAMSSGGCTGPAAAGFVCSQNGVDPAVFLGAMLTWAWYFNSDAALFDALNGAHIGGKMTALDRPGHLLSQAYTVPDPGSSLALFGLGLAACFAGRRVWVRAGASR